MKKLYLIVITMLLVGISLHTKYDYFNVGNKRETFISKISYFYDNDDGDFANNPLLRMGCMFCGK